MWHIKALSLNNYPGRYIWDQVLLGNPSVGSWVPRETWIVNHYEDRVLPREHTGRSKYPLPTTQQKTLYTWTIYRWSIPKSDWLYCLQPKMEKLYTVSKNKTLRQHASPGSGCFSEVTLGVSWHLWAHLWVLGNQPSELHCPRHFYSLELCIQMGISFLFSFALHFPSFHSYL